MIRRLYDWVLKLAGSKNAPVALGTVSFAESFIFPIPIDVMLIPMVIAKREAWFRLALLCTVTSVLGGVAGYGIGMFLEGPAHYIAGLYGFENGFEQFKTTMNEWGFWFVFAFALTPLPYKIGTIASGVLGLNIFVFILTSFLARGLRFFAVAGLLYALGPNFRTFIEKRLGLLFTLGCVLLIGGFVALKFLV